jgi:hypothetical protein
VLFGGSAVPEEQDNEAISNWFYGDTYEHFDTTSASTPRPLPFEVHSLTLSPTTVPASQVAAVVSTVMLVAPVDIPNDIAMGFNAQRYIDDPLVKGVPVIALTFISINTNTLTSSVTLGSTAITESGVVFLALDEPHPRIEATLTVTVG